MGKGVKRTQDRINKGGGRGGLKGKKRKKKGERGRRTKDQAMKD